jgi:phage shock protein B
MDFWEFMFVPTILFMSVVAPIWIALHYRSLNRSTRGLNSEDRENLEHMLETVDKLTERIDTLESLLDAEHGDWKKADAPRDSQGGQANG